MQDKQAREQAIANVRHFFIYWRNGDHKHLIGEMDISDAFTKAGYGGGAVEAVDFFSEMLPSKHYRDNSEWNARHHRLFRNFSEFEKEIPQFVQNHERVRSISALTDDNRVITLELIIKIIDQQFYAHWSLYVNKEDIGTDDLYYPSDFSISSFDFYNDAEVVWLRDFQLDHFGIALKTMVDIARAPDMAINVAAEGLEIDYKTFRQDVLIQMWNAETRLYILNHYDVDITDTAEKTSSDFADKLLAAKKKLVA